LYQFDRFDVMCYVRLKLWSILPSFRWWVDMNDRNSGNLSAILPVVGTRLSIAMTIVQDQDKVKLRT
jgi:hypothetical protein